MIKKIIAEASMGMIPMSLETFSSRYGVNPDYLEWGIVQISYPLNPKEQKDEIPSVLLKGMPLFIDIKKDIIRSFINSESFKYKKIPCSMNETVDEDGYLVYVLQGKKEEASARLEKSWIDLFFSNRILSEETIEYRLGRGQTNYHD